MARFVSLLSLAVILGLAVAPRPLGAQSPPADGLKNTLALQKAMQDARYFLQHGNDSKKAVDLLEDPFDLKNKRDLPPGGEKSKLAQQLVVKADEEFKQKRYVQARAFYEQAYQVEPDSVADRREPWAYCVLSHVADQLNQPTLS